MYTFVFSGTAIRWHDPSFAIPLSGTLTVDPSGAQPVWNLTLNDTSWSYTGGTFTSLNDMSAHIIAPYRTPDGFIFDPCMLFWVEDGMAWHQNYSVARPYSNMQGMELMPIPEPSALALLLAGVAALTTWRRYGLGKV